MKKIIYLIIAILFIKCSSNTPEEPNIPPAIAMVVTTNPDKTFSVKVTGTDSDGTISLVEIVITGGPTAVTPQSIPNGDTWKTPVLEDGMYTIKGIVTDNDGDDTSKTETKDISNVDPTMTMTVTVNANKTLTVNITGTDTDGTIAEKKVVIKQGSTEVASQVVTGASWTSSALAPGTYTVEGTVKDNKGATASDIENNVAVEGLVVSVANDTRSQEENADPNGATITSVTNEFNTASTTYVVGGDGEHLVDLSGTGQTRDLKFKAGIPAFNFEEKSSYTVTITASAPGEADVVVTVTINIVDMAETNYIYVGTTHCIPGAARVQAEAGGSFETYMVDKDGNTTSETLAQAYARIYGAVGSESNLSVGNTSYPGTITNAFDHFIRINQEITDDSNGSVFGNTAATTSTSGILHRIAFTFTKVGTTTPQSQSALDIDHNAFQKLFGQSYDDLRAAGFAWNDGFLGWQAATGNGLTADGYRYAYFTLGMGDGFARMKVPAGMTTLEAFIILYFETTNLIKKVDQSTLVLLVDELNDASGFIGTQSLLQGCN